MAWSSTAPDTTKTVKANGPILAANTTYTETTMGKDPVGTNAVGTRDHFWNVGTNEDGRHRFMQLPEFTVGGVPTDPVLGTGMDLAVYAKSDGTTVNLYTRNASGVFQIGETYLTGSTAITSTSAWANIVALPQNVFGHISIHRPASLGQYSMAEGYFRSGTVKTEGWAYVVRTTDTAAATVLQFANGTDASGLNLRARRVLGGSDTWDYRITYRKI